MGGRHQEHSRELAERLAAAGDTTTDELRALLRDPKGLALCTAPASRRLPSSSLMIWKPGS